MSKFDKTDYAEKQKEKMKELTQKLEQGVKDVFSSDEYTNYLKIMSKFHNYSASNCMLIKMQSPNATKVAGYESWKKNFERQVKKGEKGIQILAPSTKNIEVEKIDPKTKKPILDPKTNEPIIEKVISKVYYRPVHVFDINQTEGKELPSFTKELDSIINDKDKLLDLIKKVSKVPISFEEIEGAIKGYYSPTKEKIVIKEGMSDAHTIKTALHELAHSRLHSIDSDKRTAEVEAESIAFIVSENFGIDTSEYSFKYVAGWSSNRELEELKNSLATIQKEASKIITEMEKHLEELNKSIEVEKSISKKEDISEISSKEGIVVNIRLCEDIYFKAGEELSFKEANQKFKKSENEIRKLSKEADKKGEYYPYSKCAFSIIADGKKYEGRYDIGDGYSRDLLDFCKKEFKDSTLIEKLEKELDKTQKKSLKERRSDIKSKLENQAIDKKVNEKNKSER